MQQPAGLAAEPPSRRVGPWRATLAGLCASLVGIGLARFAYTPLIPALIEAGWFGPSEAVYLGAANLIGYLAGALSARALSARSSSATMLRAMMLLAAASFFACAAPLSFAWVFVWRFASGLSGGVLMVLAAPCVLPLVPPRHVGLAGGLIFTGVGLGIAASGTLVPLLLRLGLVETWLCFGALSLLLTALAWGGWPEDPPRRPAAADEGVAKGSVWSRPLVGALLIALALSYGLNAVGAVPHMVFLVDFIARGLGQGLAVGAGYWVIFGLAAMLGPVAAGLLADRIGFARALSLGFLLQAGCIAWLAVDSGALALTLSSLVIGAMVPGVPPLALGRVRELLPGDRQAQTATWGRVTAAFALGQAAGAAGFSALYDASGSYALLFALGGAALALAFLLDLAMRLSRRARLSGGESTS